MKIKGFISIVLIALLLFGTVFPLGHVFAEEEDQGEMMDAPSEDNPSPIHNNHNRCEIGGAVHWEDRKNAQGMRPNEDEIQLTLKADGKVVEGASCAWHKDEEFDQWIFFFFDQPIWDENKEKITYTVSIGDLKNYTLSKTDVEQDGTVYFPGAFYVSDLRKTLNIGKGDRFAVVKLVNDKGYLFWTESSVADTSAFLHWFDDLIRKHNPLPPFKIVNQSTAHFFNGATNEYGISISQVGGDWVIDFGDDVNNRGEIIYGWYGEETVPFTRFTETEMKTEFKATKMWEDDGEAGRPDHVEVVLRGTVSDKPDYYVIDDMAHLSKADGWTYTWTDLDRYHEGTEIDYRLYEEKIPGYISEVGYDDDYKKCVVTNSQAIVIEGKKIWEDDDDRDGLRPKEITIKLIGVAMQAQVSSEEFTVDASKDWSWKLERPKYHNGNEIKYILNEKPIEHYEHFYDGKNFINTHVPGKRDYTVEKKWVDGETLRPEEIKVQLYANDIKLGEEVVLKAPDWKHTWKDLYVNEKGKPIEYTVKEVSVPKGFVGSYLAIDNGVSITNTYAIPHTDVTAEKKWHNAPDEKPDIWFKLYRQLKGGKPEEVPGAEVLKVKDNKASWTGIEETDKEGNGYSFSVKEVDKDGKDYIPEGYEKEEKGLVVTNSFTKKPDKKPLPSTGQKGTPLLIGGGVILLAAAFFFLRKSKNKA